MNYHRKYALIFGVVVVILPIVQYPAVFFSRFDRAAGNFSHQDSELRASSQLEGLSSSRRFRILQKETVAGTRRYTIDESLDGADAQPLLQGRALLLMRDNEAFRNELLSVLREKPPEAYFFETPAASAATVGTRPFEFVLVPAPILEHAVADPRCVRLYERA